MFKLEQKKGIFDKILLWVGSFFLIGMILLVFAQILFRFVIQHPISWSEELARGFFIWASVIGATLGVAEKSHSSVTIFIDKLPPNIRKLVINIVEIIIIIFLIIVAKEGITLTALTYKNYSAILKIPMGYFYASIPIACATMVIYEIRNLIIWNSNRGEDK